MTRGRSAAWLALALVSAPLTTALAWATLPASLFFGPMLAAIAFALAGIRLQLSRASFLFTQAILGCMVGRTLTGAILTTIAQDWMIMVLVVATTVLAGGIVGALLYRYGALPGTTAAWGSSPGAAAAIIAMAGEYGADVQLVAFMAYLRVIIVVFTAAVVSRLVFGAAPHAVAGGVALGLDAPPLAVLATLAIAIGGAWLGTLLRLPGGALLVPMLATAATQASGLTAIALPPWLLALGYTGLGWYVGLGFTRRVVKHALRALPQILLATAFLMALCIASAWLLMSMTHADALTAYLATSPGGMDSMAIIAAASRADIPLVMSVQTLRLFVVMVTGPQIARLICRHVRPKVPA